MSTKIPPTCVVAPTTKHTATVIFLHGRDQSGLGWRPAIDAIKDKLSHVKWLHPNAPIRTITANSVQNRPDRDGLLESAGVIGRYIQDKVKIGIPSERIVVGGFSQGRTLSLLVGLTNRGGGWELGGVFPLCSWIPLGDEFANMVFPHLIETPVLICHGIVDDLVTNDMVHHTRKFLFRTGTPRSRV